MANSAFTLGPLTAESFTSTEQTITAGGNLTLAHGLSTTPIYIYAELVCKTAEFGFSVGDRVKADYIGQANSGVGLTADATNVEVDFGSSGITVIRQDTQDTANITVGNWNLVVRAFTNLPATDIVGNGKILQVQTTTKTDTFTTTSTTFTDLTGLSVSITPAATSSTVLVFGSVVIGEANQNGTAIQIVRDSTAIGIGDAAGSRTRSTSAARASGTSQAETMSFNYVDSPSTTSATTYKIQIRTEGGSGTIFVNRSSADTDSANSGRYISTITVMEIAA